jgi:hypothetical protein
MAEDNPRVIVLDGITQLTASHAGSVVISGSHGGLYPAALAGRGSLRGAIFSDAGVGLDAAGIEGLGFLEALGLAGATVDYRSARIGDGIDAFARGIISHVNEPAAKLGCVVGQPASLCAERMKKGEMRAARLTSVAEGRLLLRAEAPQIWAVDCISLAGLEDTGAILVAGSHGGLSGRNPATAIGQAALAAAFNDAGVGADKAGIARLPVLDRRGIAGVTVSAASARIGHARSSWETGIISACNHTAALRGAREGMKLSVFFTDLAAHAAGSGLSVHRSA